jgi:hypothetical protein
MRVKHKFVAVLDLLEITKDSLAVTSADAHDRGCAKIINSQ